MSKQAFFCPIYTFVSSGFGSELQGIESSEKKC